MIYVQISIIVSIFSLIFAGAISFYIKKQKIKDEKAKEISHFIHRGAMTFLNQEYKILIFFVIIIALLLYFFIGHNTAWSFLAGSFLSALAGNIGIRIATASNVRTAEKAKSGLKQALGVAFNSGAVMGMVVVGLGLLGVAVFYLLFRDSQAIYGFGLGASAVALFARVGGGIYTKAADVGADLVGKIEAGIPEDDACHYC